MLNGVDPENRIQIEDIVAQFTELIANGHGLPPKKEMSDIFTERDYGEDGKQISHEQHVEALSELFMDAVILLAERKAEEIKSTGMEIHVLMNGESGPDHVEIKVGGYRDPRYAVAALAKLDEMGYLNQMWNIAVRGKVDPNGPQVFFQDHIISKKEESA
jgi:hypothetical protein